MGLVVSTWRFTSSIRLEISPEGMHSRRVKFAIDSGRARRRLEGLLVPVEGIEPTHPFE